MLSVISIYVNSTLFCERNSFTGAQPLHNLLPNMVIFFITRPPMYYYPLIVRHFGRPYNACRVFLILVV